MQPKNYAELERRIDYTFKNENILKTALTHSSYSNEQRAKNISVNCNERLEFLGDSVLSIIVSEFLFKGNHDIQEGDLTKRRAEIVCGRSLSGFATEIGLGEYLYLGNGEEAGGGRTKPTILENAFEALLAAMYLDCGCDKARVAEFLLPFVKKELARLLAVGHGADFKTKLQQFVQQNEGDFLEYLPIGESGPDHQKVFTVAAMLNHNEIGRGSGRTKKEAEQNAAREACILFSVE